MDVLQIVKSDRGVTPIIPVRLHANQQVVVSRHCIPPQPQGNRSANQVDSPERAKAIQ
jgi:hypothetical protein